MFGLGPAEIFTILVVVLAALMVFTLSAKVLGDAKRNADAFEAARKRR